MSRRRAVITGIGPITCVGRGRENFWNGILSEKSGISGISGFDASAFHVRCAGEIRDWDSEEFFAPHRLKRLDRYAHARRRGPVLFARESTTSRWCQFWHGTRWSMQGRRSIHPISEKGRPRSSAHARCPGFWRVSPFEHRN